MPIKNQRAFRPEEELLLCCARVQPNAIITDRIRALLHTELDWAYLINIAKRHTVQPLLYWNLKTIYSEPVPPAVLAQLQQDFKTNAWLNQLLNQALVQIAKSFETNGIRLMPLKGIALTASIYGNLSLRHAGDLDILVAKQDLQSARALLQSQGYRPSPLPRKNDDSKQQPYHDELFLRDDHGRFIWVELHRQLMPPYIFFPLNFEALWERRQSISLSGTAVANLSPDDLLLYLCLHGTRHAWLNLRFLCDITAILHIHHKELAWTKIIEQADAYRSQRMFLLGLFLASDLFGATLPEVVWDRIGADPEIKSLSRWVSTHLFRENRYAFVQALERFFFRFKALESRQDRGRYLRFFFNLKAISPLQNKVQSVRSSLNRR